MIIREIDWERDGEAVRNFDASFSTNIIYRVHVADLSVQLIPENIDPPVQKKYSLAELTEADATFVAEIDGEIAGFVSVRIDDWNDRAVITQLFVGADAQRQGFGRSLIAAAEDHAKDNSARCLWAETQNINYPAIQFYKSVGFNFCGFDRSLYTGEEAGETAVFFSRPI